MDARAKKTDNGPQLCLAQGREDQPRHDYPICGEKSQAISLRNKLTVKLIEFEESQKTEEFLERERGIG